MGVEVVAFDVHGTLLHWPAGRVQGLEIQQLLERYGISISYQALEVARQTVLYLDAQRRPVHGFVDLLALAFDRLGVSVPLDLIESIAAMHAERDEMVPYADAAAALRGVRTAGRTTCAFTTLPRFMLGQGRETGEVVRLLDHYFDLSAVGVVKGDARFYRRIAERLKVEAGRILAVGDDAVCDCRLPVAAGWQAVLLDRSGDAARQVGQRGTIRSLSELGRFID